MLRGSGSSGCTLSRGIRGLRARVGVDGYLIGCFLSRFLESMILCASLLVSIVVIRLLIRVNESCDCNVGSLD